MTNLWRVAVVSATLGLAVIGPAGAAEDPSLDQEIAEDQQIATEPAVLSDGHVDLGPAYVDGEWTLLVHDATVATPVWRTTADTVFQVSDAAVLTVPDDAAYAFLPAEPGTDVHVVPQAQQPEVVWVGWNTQDPTVMDAIDRGVTLSLRGVQGPGELVVFLQSGTLGDPEMLWDSREAYPQELWVDVNTHTHANWVFSEPGVYLVEVEVSADLLSGRTESDTEVLRFAVGDQTSADEALAAEYLPAAGGAEPEATAAAEAEEGDDSAGGLRTGLLVAVGIAAVLAVVLIVVLVQGNRAKKRARAKRAGSGAAPGGSA